MRIIKFLFLLLAICASAHAQTTSADKDLLARLNTIYDTPFRHGLINFDCAIRFDFEQHLKDSFGAVPPGAASLVKALQPIQYRVFVDRSGAVASPQSKLPDLTSIPHGTELEESNRNLLQTGFSNWIPYASGTMFPLGPTNYHFEQDLKSKEYKLSMNGDNLDAALWLSADLRLLGGIIEKPQHIDITTEFTSSADGLVLASTSTNTNNEGVAKVRYTYQVVDGFQIPASINIASEQKLTWLFHLTDCKVQHGQVVKVRPTP